MRRSRSWHATGCCHGCCHHPKKIAETVLTDRRVNQSGLEKSDFFAGSDFSVGFFDDLLEIIFAGFDDAKFAFGIFGRIAGMCGIHHDG